MTTATHSILTLDEVAGLSLGPVALTLGVFDGVHRGHRYLLSATREAAAARDARPVALVFEPPPIEVIRPDVTLQRLAPLAENLEHISDAGVLPIAMRFDPAVRDLPPEVFVDRLGPGLRPAAIVMTSDGAFGKDRSGTSERLTEIGSQRGFEVVAIEPETDDGVISSTRIRQALATGDVAEAQRLLGRLPAVTGTVVRGDGRGRELGYPTANLRFSYRPALPALGIYAGWAIGQPALISLGRRPVFHTDGDVVFEAHLLDWDGDLYDQELRVEVATRLRDERKFASVQDLIDQMKRDESEARAALKVAV
ncbi:MAG TPA: riboflavin biosynthesis protein RibF [Candidatus Limnocylindria bacterium]|nr:riboflavin biosynthesis protein RibF [Candidatus Limnocylindria bacterium]